MIARLALPIGVVVLWPRWLGLLAAVIAFLAMPRLLRLFENERAREKRLGVDREVPLLAELLSAHLISGAGLLDSLQSIAPALDSQLGALTEEVATRLTTGERNPCDPWRSIPSLQRLADACERSLRSGSSMSTAMLRIGERMRAQEGRQRQADLERAVIRMTLPLGICLLPAFVATVVIPMAYVLFEQVQF